MVNNAPAATSRQANPLLDVLSGHALDVPPVWLMRQAGRYLPEYRRVRAEAGGFLNLCYSPKLVCEVTLQPIRRFDLDAAILFSDILVVPHAMGQEVWFSEGEGPRLAPITTAAEFMQLQPEAAGVRFEPIYEAVTLIREALADNKTLIGFCGAPWTVATYMVAGQGSPDQAAARLWAYRDSDGFADLIAAITETSIDYLCGQITAGVNAVQIFDSWAGSLPDDAFERWVVQPTQQIVRAVHARHPGFPIIGFPRGASAHGAHYVAATGVTALGCDTAMPVAVMQTLSASGVVVQGNLDPLSLVVGGEQLDRRVGHVLQAMRGRPYIFNLGHGIVPATPPDHVARLVQVIRSGTWT